MNAHAPPPGALAPGTCVQVGAYRVTVQRYLSRGGFALVYLVSQEDPHAPPLVLKCMTVYNRDALRSVRAEVDHHRKLKGYPTIVNFIEASASSLPNDGWEIFILMEYCEGGALIDFMNTRLQHRLSEAEVLSIFRDVTAAVAVMHACEPPLVHRDLKIENVLLSSKASPTFKLCDFGSCFPVLSNKPAQSPEEIKRLEAELNMHTTLQYRSPEMVDLSMRKPINEKSDIWALGVLLYKLCYYTTPFEGPGGGPLAIVQARFEYPKMPVYSIELRALIGTLIQADPEKRPSAGWVLTRIDAIRGVKQNNIPRKPVRKTQRPMSMPPAAKLPSPAPAPAPTPAAAPLRARGPPTTPGSARANLGAAPGGAVAATTAPASPAPAAAPKPSQDTLISLDDTDKRFPSIEVLDAIHKPSVRARVAELNASPARNRDKEHTSVLLSVDSSDDEGPESVDKFVPVIRARSKETVQDTVLAIDSPRTAAKQLEEDIRPQPGMRAQIAALFEARTPTPPLLPTQNAKDTRAKHDPELDALAQHEKALSDLLGTELVSVETDAPSKDRAPQSSAAPVKDSAPSAAALRAPPWDEPVESRSARNAPLPGPKPQAVKEPAAGRPGPSASAPTLKESPRKPSQAPSQASSQTPSQAPTPTLAQPAPGGPAEAPRKPAPTTAPKPGKTQHRASTWDVASKVPSNAQPKQYVDVATSPIASPVMQNASLLQPDTNAATKPKPPKPSTGLKPVQTLAKPAASNESTPKIEPRNETPTDTASSDAQPSQNAAPSPSRPSEPRIVKPTPIRAKPVNRVKSVPHETPTPKSSQSPMPEHVIDRTTSDTAQPSASKKPPPPNLMDEDDPPLGLPQVPAAKLSPQLLGQPRLTKRPTQSGTGAAVSLRPWEQSAAPPQPSDEPEAEFQGVSALISRWQSLGK
ncbi:non-specific serine/threonine protein kinase [Malassezia cuniculi]|uniref:non-specific serine/threonine protein kinase n=1 Tax=Malassezia cuniculi TaxID=948313 RepID=A0AAF0EZU9_9BASI|nr:non-specific serine/threonine protein kinase [Malassezia cuniculi]